MEWNDHRTDLLKAQWAQGLPATLIARAIGEGCTKNMVIGKANRLGLPEREKGAAMTAWWHKIGKHKWRDRQKGSA